MIQKTRKSAEARLKRIRDRRIGCFFIIIVILGFLAYVYSARKYNQTFIPFHYIASGSLLAGLTIGTLNLKYFHSVTGKRYDSWQHYVCISVIYGFFLSSLFFWTNAHFSKSNTYIVKARILAVYQTWKYQNISLKVNVYDIEKEIPMPNVELSEIEKADFVILRLKKGYWGFPFIIYKELSRN